MRKRNFRYYCRMVVKTLVILLPIIAIIFGSVVFAVAPNSTYYLGMIDQFDEFATNFLNLGINHWYLTFLTAIEFDEIYNAGASLVDILLILPLWFIWVEIFDLLLHLIFFFTDLFHKFLGAEK